MSENSLNSINIRAVAYRAMEVALAKKSEQVEEDWLRCREERQQKLCRHFERVMDIDLLAIPEDELGFAFAQTGDEPLPQNLDVSFEYRGDMYREVIDINGFGYAPIGFEVAYPVCPQCNGRAWSKTVNDPESLGYVFDDLDKGSQKWIGTPCPCADRREMLAVA